MNKITSCMTVVAALAVGSAFAELTPFDKLELAEAVTFSGAPTGELTGDLTGAAAYTLAQPKPTGSDILKDVEKFTVAFKVGFVDFSELQGTDGAKLKPTDAKIGFAFTDATHAAYFNGSDWAQVAVDTVAEEEPKTLLIELDRRDTTKKARFTLGSTHITGWVSVADVVSNTVAIYGSGVVTSVNGTTFTITAEVIVVNPDGEGEVNIDFTPTQMTDLASKFDCTPSDVPAKLTSEATKGANGNTALVNYVLFGEVGTTVDKTLVVKGNPTGGDADNVAISIPNLNLQTVTGATVSFQLQGRATTEDTWQDVDGATSLGGGAFTFPANTDYRYFKVVTTITYGK